MWAPIPDQNNPNIDLIDGVEAHLNNSNIDHDNGPRTQNNGIYMYVSIYVSFILRLSQPDSRDPCTPWNAPCMPVLLTCSRAWFTTALLELLVWLTDFLTLLWRLSTKTGRWACRHMVSTDSACWDRGAVVARQLANAPSGIRSNRRADCTAVLYRHRPDAELIVPACYLWM